MRVAVGNTMMQLSFSVFTRVAFVDSTFAQPGAALLERQGERRKTGKSGHGETYRKIIPHFRGFRFFRVFRVLQGFIIPFFQRRFPSIHC